MSQAITEAMVEAAAKVLNDRLAKEEGLFGVSREMLSAALSSVPPAVPGEVEPHTDDLAVDRFAAAMKAKLAEKRAQGYHGWDDPEDCTIEHLSNLLVKHVGKGDPVDVGNFAMMIHQRGGRIK